MFSYGKRPARPAKPVDTIPYEGEVFPFMHPFLQKGTFQAV